MSNRKDPFTVSIKLDPKIHREEIQAVWDGDIDGDYYASDDETWADIDSMQRWQRAVREVGMRLKDVPGL